MRFLSVTAAAIAAHRINFIRDISDNIFIFFEAIQNFISINYS